MTGLTFSVTVVLEAGELSEFFHSGSLSKLSFLVLACSCYAQCLISLSFAHATVAIVNVGCDETGMYLLKRYVRLSKYKNPRIAPSVSSYHSSKI